MGKLVEPVSKASPVVEVVPSSRLKSRRRTPWQIHAAWVPGAFLLVMLGVPLYWIVRLSLGFPTFNAQAYVALWEGSTHIRVMRQTLSMAVVATLTALILGYPAAYVMARLRSPWRQLALCAVLLPLWTSLLVRTYAWFIILSPARADKPVGPTPGLYLRACRPCLQPPRRRRRPHALNFALRHSPDLCSDLEVGPETRPCRRKSWLLAQPHVPAIGFAADTAGSYRRGLVRVPARSRRLCHPGPSRWHRRAHDCHDHRKYSQSVARLEPRRGARHRVASRHLTHSVLAASLVRLRRGVRRRCAHSPVAAEPAASDDGV